jgi:hypothetical protein
MQVDVKFRIGVNSSNKPEKRINLIAALRLFRSISSVSYHYNSIDSPNSLTRSNILFTMEMDVKQTITDPEAFNRRSNL